jgi:hypothetical protein
MYKTFVLSREAYFNGCQLEYYETDTAFMSNVEYCLNNMTIDGCEIVSVQFFDDVNRRPYKCIITRREKETK